MRKISVTAGKTLTAGAKISEVDQPTKGLRKNARRAPLIHGQDGLPEGVRIIPLDTLSDERGELTEIFRNAWIEPVNFVQWNFVKSKAKVLRGVHVHALHTDFLVFLSGRVQLGLQDLRDGRMRAGSLLTLTCDKLFGIVIPPGVAHGFYFLEDSLHAYAVDQYWDMKDELGCYFADPDLSIPWNVSKPILSPRDAELPDLKTVKQQLRQFPTLSP